VLDAVLQFLKSPVKPWEPLDRATAPDGAELTLMRQDDEFVIFADGKPLMSSRLHGSEEALATLGCRHARTLPRPSVLVGGLGMGFTLRAALDLLPPQATVVISELFPAVVDWNRGLLATLAGRPLDDRRVRLKLGDVGALLRSSPGRFDAVLLDVDNSPDAFSASGNAELYGHRGVAALRAALRPRGLLAVWSAKEDRRFVQRLRRGGFSVEVAHVRGGPRNAGPRHVIFLAC
jgi:spermidine synthase